ncbi:MAG: hypothetical protein LC131_12940 [Anaerolineae bacterium]|nr:hypothetical protein [Anaerolineae bacterium]HNS39365.1 hypothetical protein [Promineifilum sp.]
MTLATIEIELDERTAKTFADASVDTQEKIRALFSVWLREFEGQPTELGQLMDQISDKAASHGLTPEILETLLEDE